MPQNDRSPSMPAFRRPAAAARAVPADAIALAAPGTPNTPFIERPSTARGGSGWIGGSTGCRKSTLFTNLQVQSIAYEYAHVPPGARRSWVLFDLKGDGCEPLLGGLARIPGALENTYYLDPFARNGAPGQFPLNLMRADTAGLPKDLLAVQFAHLIGHVSGAGVLAMPLGGRQMERISSTAYAAWETPGSSPIWIVDALSSPSAMDRLAARCPNERARRFLQAVRLPPDAMAATWTRVKSVLSPYAEVENMFGASSSLDWARLTAPGVTTIVRMGDPPGGGLELVEFFASLLVRQCVSYLLASRQSPWPGHATTIAIDECQLAAVGLQDVLRRLVETGRSRNIQILLISQGTRALRDASGALFESLLTNSRYAITGRLASADSALYVREALGPAVAQSAASRIVSELISLPPGEFYFSEANGLPIRFKAMDADREGWARALRANAAAIEAMKRRLCPRPLPPASHLEDAPEVAPAVRAADDRVPTPPQRRRPRSRLG